MRGRGGILRDSLGMSQFIYMRYKGIKAKAWEIVRKICFARSPDCYTCPAKNLITYNRQAGHFLPVALVGSNNTLSWDTRQIHTQCGNCNGKGQGMQVEYRKRLVSEYGEAEVTLIEQRRWRVNPVKDWEELISHLKEELKSYD